MPGSVRHSHDTPVPSPLARGTLWRLGWALGLAALLWLGVLWALI